MFDLIYIPNYQLSNVYMFKQLMPENLYSLFPQLKSVLVYQKKNSPLINYS